MKPTTGLRQLDENLFVEGEPLIVYGEPASGKTNLVLKIVKESLRSGMNTAYISTEGSIVVERMEEMGILDFPNLSIGFANSFPHLAQLVSWAAASDYSLIAIDSVNSLYRSSVGFARRANEIFLGILAMMKFAAASGKWVVATAQVREVGEEVEPSGADLIGFYFSNIARIYRVGGGRRVLEVRGKKYILNIIEVDVVLAAT
jgi:predicted ATP-dependent serine protease